MSTHPERILLVESNPDVIDLVARQALRPLGYHTKVITETPRAIQEAVHYSPDAMLVNINMPGLSGKDLLVALSSQGVDVPVIVIAEEGMEADVIQAFRLGASDYIQWPLREAEVVAAVERALKQVRARKERQRLAQKLELANRELQRRIRDLTIIFRIGKTVTSVADQRMLFAHIVDGAVTVTDADMGWLHVRKGRGKTFVLRAQKNLPKTIATRLSHTWDDGISSLVALSGEALAVHGEALKKFKIARLGQAALVVPVKAQEEVLGLLVVVRKKSVPFDAGNQAMLEAVADYASISLVNARLFKALEQRAHRLQAAVELSSESEKFKGDVLVSIRDRLKPAVSDIKTSLKAISEEATENQQKALDDIRVQLNRIAQVVDALEQLNVAGDERERVSVNLVELAEKAADRHRADAEVRGVKMQVSVPSRAVFIKANVAQLNKVFDALLSNAVRYAGRRGQVNIRVESRGDGWAQVTIQDSGPGLDAEQQKQVFLPFYQGDSEDEARSGMGLTVAREIIKVHGGKIWVDPQYKDGAAFHFRLPEVSQQDI